MKRKSLCCTGAAAAQWRAVSVEEVIASNSPDFNRGDHAFGMLGWATPRRTARPTSFAQKSI